MERNVVNNKKNPQKQKQYTVKLNVTTVKQEKKKITMVIVSSLRIKVNWRLLILRNTFSEILQPQQEF